MRTTHRKTHICFQQQLNNMNKHTKHTTPHKQTSNRKDITQTPCNALKTLLGADQAGWQAGLPDPKTLSG